MIRDGEKLSVVREQLARIERALASLRRRVKNQRNLAVYSEGYVDQIAELKADIDSYRAAKRKKPAQGKRKATRKPQKT